MGAIPKLFTFTSVAVTAMAITAPAITGCSAIFGVDDYDSTDAGTGGAGVAGGGEAGMSSVGGGAAGGGDGGGGAGAGGGMGGGGMGGCPTFTDGFERGDSAVIGNNWVQKNGTFALMAGEIVVTTTVTEYANSLVRQPRLTALDVEASIEFVPAVTTPGWPNVSVRIQEGTADLADQYDGYMFFRDHGDGAFHIARQRTSSFVSLGSGFFALTPGMRYRMTLRATGTDPVMLDAWVHEDVNGTWTERISLTGVEDTHSDRVATTGNVGFTTHSDAAFVFDNFVACKLD